MTTPILISAFGARSTGARAVYAAIEAELRAAFPGRKLTRAYTAASLVARLRAEGEPASTLAEAYAGLLAMGHRAVAVSSLHLVPGEKHQEAARAVPEGLRAEVAAPLLADGAALGAVAEALLRELPADRPCLVVAHGHAREPRYNAELLALKARLAEARADVHLALLEGDGDRAGLEALVARARACGRAHLDPFLLVAGDHVAQDLLGEEADSFRSRLGVPDCSIGAVLGERAWVRDAFRGRLEAALQRLERP